ncbi:MAG TPA: PH domain-containing protein [Micromonosporaceae bacterium]|nr:PH domain-containing protein [Micromonosporaceae bacterium]
MGFPENELTTGEHVVLHFHPHWKQMVGPYALLVVVVAGLIAALLGGVGGVLMFILGVAGLVLVVWLTLIPFIKWRCIHYVVSNERVITRRGVFSQHTENIPIDRVSDVQFDQTLFERILGCGKLALASPGEHGPDVLPNIPHIKHVVATLHDLLHPDEVPAPQQREAAQDGTTRSVQDGTTQQLNN